EVPGAGAEIDRRGRVAGDVLRDLERAGDLRRALLVHDVAQPGVDLLVAEPLAEGLAHFEEGEPEVERPVRQTADRIGEADAPFLARPGGQIVLERERRRRRIAAVEERDRLLHRRGLALER